MLEIGTIFLSFKEAGRINKLGITSNKGRKYFQNNYRIGIQNANRLSLTFHPVPEKPKKRSPWLGLFT